MATGTQGYDDRMRTALGEDTVTVEHRRVWSPDEIGQAGVEGRSSSSSWARNCRKVSPSDWVMEPGL